MNVPLITWSCIVAVFLLALALRIYSVVRHSVHSSDRRKIFSIGREWEEIYVPGDRRIKDDYDYDEFDDL